MVLLTKAAVCPQVYLEICTENNEKRYNPFSFLIQLQTQSLFCMSSVY